MCIADFGLARSFGLPTSTLTPRVVTLWYRSPELLLGSQEYTTAIDIWSAGCILGELLNSKPLLPGENEPNQLSLIVQLLGSPSESIWPGYSSLPLSNVLKFPLIEYDDLSLRFPNATQGTIQLLKRMLTYWPKKRYTALEALNSLFFEEYPPPCHPIMLPTFPELRNNIKSS